MNTSVAASIGDHKWIKAKDDAEKVRGVGALCDAEPCLLQRIMQARITLEREIDNMLEAARSRAASQGRTMLDVLLEEQQHVLYKEESMVGADALIRGNAGDAGPRGDNEDEDEYKDDAFESPEHTSCSQTASNAESSESSPSKAPVRITAAMQPLQPQSSVPAVRIPAEIPVYQAGGTVISGIGELLGNALALLYVARLGLRESELWKILYSLQQRECEARANASKRFTVAKSIVENAYEIRGEVLDMLRWASHIESTLHPE
jgi:hypothetical protein